MLAFECGYGLGEGDHLIMEMRGGLCGGDRWFTLALLELRCDVCICGYCCLEAFLEGISFFSGTS